MGNWQIGSPLAEKVPCTEAVWEVERGGGGGGGASIYTNSDSTWMKPNLVRLARPLRTGSCFSTGSNLNTLRHWIRFRFHFTSTAAAAPNTTDLLEVHRHHTTQHTKAPRERSKSIKSRLLSSLSHSTLMPPTKRSVQCRSTPNKPKQTINNSGCCVAIGFHGFESLHQHPNTANPTCSCLAAISNMAVQSFCRLVGQGNPAPASNANGSSF